MITTSGAGNESLHCSRANEENSAANRATLEPIAFKKGLAVTPQQARQMVVHRRVLISNHVVSIPSYLVSVDDEKSILIKTPSAKKEDAPSQEVQEVTA